MAILATLTLLTAKQFGQMGKLQAFFGSGQDATALQDDLRRLLSDPLRCVQSIRPDGGHFREQPKELPIVMPGGEVIAKGSKLTRYSLKEAYVNVISSREIFHHTDRHERVWAFELDLLGVRTTGENLKPRSIGSVYLRLDEQRKVNGCSLDSRSLMRCQAGEILEMNQEKGLYECLNMQELAETTTTCPDGMKPDLSDGGKSCVPIERSPSQLRAIETASDIQSMLKDPTKLVNPEALQKVLGNLQEQVKEMCLNAGGQWTATGCQQ